MTLLRSLFLLVGLTLAASCSEPSTAKTLLKDPAGYQDGWRDAGFRKDPADQTTLNYVWGWWPAQKLEAFGDTLMIYSPGDGTGGGLYRHLAGSSQFDFVPLPHGEKVANIYRGSRGLLVWSGSKRLWIYSPGSESWDSTLPPVYPPNIVGWASTANAGDTVFFQGNLQRCTNGACDTISGGLFWMDARIGRLDLMPNSDTSVRMNSVAGVSGGWIIGENGGKLAYWNRSETKWVLFTGTRNVPGLGGSVQGFAFYQGTVYAGSYLQSYTFRNGVWDTIANQGTYPDGKVAFRWGWNWGFKNINDTLYSHGSSVRRLNPSTGAFEEVAASFESGKLPPGSIYATKNQGCFHMGDVRSMAKIGDTIYAATATGLWKIGVSRAVVCPTVYNRDDTCGRVAKLEMCISDPDVYCCEYDHAGFTPCDGHVCPASRKAAMSNPVAPAP